MCSECGKRRVLVRIKGKGRHKKLPARTHHDLCRQCFESMRAKAFVHPARSGE